MADVKTSKTRERILAAAVSLFAQFGYCGVSTREIAHLAKVNEITVYRYYPKKHDLFMAAVESEMQKLHIRPELVTRLMSAPDLRSSLRGISELIGGVLAQQPSLARLLQFSALEFGAVLAPLYRKHLGSVLELGIGYLQCWVDAGELNYHDPRILILAFATTIVSLPTFYPAIWDEQLPSSSDQSLAAFCADSWYRALAGEPKEE
jgi:AcrR family transcriptional regulator